jgi:hypothetical protein
MPESPDLKKTKADLEDSAAPRQLSLTEFQDFKHVTNGLVQDAINVWDELWAELDDTGEPGALIKLESGFEPSCGWTEYLQKMWTLRHTLNFAKKYSRQSSETLCGHGKTASSI